MTTSTELTATINRKSERAQATLAAVKSGAATLAADPTATAKTWGQFANSLAESEGQANLWERVAQMAAYKGENVTEADIKAIVLDALSPGADDSWSGRDNDVARARFDGMLRAASDTCYI